MFKSNLSNLQRIAGIKVSSPNQPKCSRPFGTTKQRKQHNQPTLVNTKQVIPSHTTSTLTYNNINYFSTVPQASTASIQSHSIDIDATLSPSDTTETFDTVPKSSSSNTHLKPGYKPNFIPIGPYAGRQAELKSSHGKKYTFELAKPVLDDILKHKAFRNFDPEVLSEQIIYVPDTFLSSVNKLFANTDAMLEYTSNTHLIVVFRAILHYLDQVRKGEFLDVEIFAGLYNLLFTRRFSNLNSDDYNNIRVSLFCAVAYINSPGLTLYLASCFDRLPVFKRSIAYFPFLTRAVAAILDGKFNASYDRKLRASPVIQLVDLESFLPALIDSGYVVVSQTCEYIAAQREDIAKRKELRPYDARYDLAALILKEENFERWSVLLANFISQYTFFLHSMKLTNDVFPLIQTARQALNPTEVFNLYIKLIEAAVIDEKYIPAMTTISLMRREGFNMQQCVGYILLILCKTENVSIARQYLASSTLEVLGAKNDNIITYDDAVTQLLSIKMDRWQHINYVLNTLLLPTSISQLWTVMNQAYVNKRFHIVLTMFNTALSNGLIQPHNIPSEIARLNIQALIRVGTNTDRYPVIFKKDAFDPVLLDPDTMFIFFDSASANGKYPDALVFEVMLSLRLAMYSAETSPNIPIPSCILESDLLYLRQNKSIEYAILRVIQKVRSQWQNKFHQELSKLKDSSNKSSQYSRYRLDDFLSMSDADMQRPMDLDKTMLAVDAMNKRLDAFYLETFVELELSSRFMNRREQRIDDHYFIAFWTACSLGRWKLAQELLEYANYIDPTFFIEGYYLQKISEVVQKNRKHGLSMPSTSSRDAYVQKLGDNAYSQNESPYFGTSMSIGNEATLENPYIPSTLPTISATKPSTKQQIVPPSSISFGQNTISEYGDLIMSMRQQMLVYKDLLVPPSYMKYHYSRQRDTASSTRQSSEIKNNLYLSKMTVPLDIIRRMSPHNLSTFKNVASSYYTPITKTLTKSNPPTTQLESKMTPLSDSELFTAYIHLIRARYNVTHLNFRQSTKFQPLQHPPYKTVNTPPHLLSVAVRINQPTVYQNITGIFMQDRFIAKETIPLLQYDIERMNQFATRQANLKKLVYVSLFDELQGNAEFSSEVDAERLKEDQLRVRDKYGIVVTRNDEDGNILTVDTLTYYPPTGSWVERSWFQERINFFTDFTNFELYWKEATQKFKLNIQKYLDSVKLGKAISNNRSPYNQIDPASLYVSSVAQQSSNQKSAIGHMLSFCKRQHIPAWTQKLITRADFIQNIYDETEMKRNKLKGSPSKTTNITPPTSV